MCLNVCVVKQGHVFYTCVSFYDVLVVYFFVSFIVFHIVLCLVVLVKHSTCIAPFLFLVTVYAMFISRDEVVPGLPLWKLYVDPDVFVNDCSSWNLFGATLSFFYPEVNAFNSTSSGSFLDSFVAAGGFDLAAVRGVDLLQRSSAVSAYKSVAVGFHVALPDKDSFTHVRFLFASRGVLPFEDPAGKYVQEASFPAPFTNVVRLTFNDLSSKVSDVGSFPDSLNTVGIGDVSFSLPSDLATPFSSMLASVEHVWLHKMLALWSASAFHPSSMYDFWLGCPSAHPHSLAVVADALSSGFQLSVEQVAKLLARPSCELSDSQNDFRLAASHLVGSVDPVDLCAATGVVLGVDPDVVL